MRVQLPGAAIEVEDHGEGVPLVLLHGFPLSGEIWVPLRPALEEVARVVTPDLRGFGRSDKPAGSYAMEVLAEDVAALADVLALDRFVLGGHSMGGYVALRFAAAHRERLLGLLLVDSRAEADTDEARAGRNAAIETIGREGPVAFLDAFVPKLVGPSTRARAPRFLAELRALAEEVPAHVLAAALAGMRDRPDSSPLLTGLDLPVLVLVGAEDSLIPVAQAEKLVRGLPRGELVTVPEAGHTPSVERPVVTGEAVTAFLRRHFAGL